MAAPAERRPERARSGCADVIAALRLRSAASVTLSGRGNAHRRGTLRCDRDPRSPPHAIGTAAHARLTLPGLVPEPADAWTAALPRLPALQRLLARAQRSAFACEHLPAFLLGSFGVTRAGRLAGGAVLPAGRWSGSGRARLAAGRSGPSVAAAEQPGAGRQPPAAALRRGQRRVARGREPSFRAGRADVVRTAPAALVPARAAAAADSHHAPPKQPRDAAWTRCCRTVPTRCWCTAGSTRSRCCCMSIRSTARARRAVRLAVNSLWLWGAGQPGAATGAGARPACGREDPLLRGLARASGLPVYAPPAGAEDWLAHAGTASTGSCSTRRQQRAATTRHRTGASTPSDWSDRGSRRCSPPCRPGACASSRSPRTAADRRCASRIAPQRPVEGVAPADRARAWLRSSTAPYPEQCSCRAAARRPPSGAGARVRRARGLHRGPARPVPAPPARPGGHAQSARGGALAGRRDRARQAPADRRRLRLRRRDGLRRRPARAARLRAQSSTTWCRTASSSATGSRRRSCGWQPSARRTS